MQIGHQLRISSPASLCTTYRGKSSRAVQFGGIRGSLGVYRSRVNFTQAARRNIRTGNATGLGYPFRLRLDESDEAVYVNYQSLQ